ncbi:MAG: FG-GAP repeat domain-containing protein [Candidatus Binatia bacterium]
MALLLAVLCAAGCVSPGVQVRARFGFTPYTVSAGGRTPFGVAVADFNGDDRADLAVSDVASGAIALLLQSAEGTFSPAAQWRAGKVPRGLVASDLNADGHMDLVVATVRSGVVVFLGDGHGGAVRTAYPAGLAPFNVAVADLDNDGSLDIVVANESNMPALQGRGTVSVLFGDGHGTFPRTVTLEADSYPADVKVADLNGDGRLDIVVVNWKSADVSLFLGQGDGTFAAARAVPYGGMPSYSLAVADLNHDGTPDIAVGDVQGLVRVLSNDGAAGFTAGKPLTAGAGLRTVITADLNGDGLADLATANTQADTVTVLLALPAGGFGPPSHIAVGTRPRAVSAADLNGDGTLDLVVTNGGSDNLSLLMNHSVASS